MLEREARRGGQMAVVIAMVLFTLVIFVAFATNMGILVNDRIRMQNATDLGAYSGAYTQAAALNELAYINDQIIQELIQCREALEAAWPIQAEYCSCDEQSGPPGPINLRAEQFIDQCELRVEALVGEFRAKAAYSATTARAISSAKATMEANLRNLSTNSETHFFDGDTFLGTSATHASAYTTAGSPTIADFTQMTTVLNYLAIPSCPCPTGCCNFPQRPSPENPIPSYFVKEAVNPDVWFMAQGAGTMDTPYLDIGYSEGGNDGGYFGGSSSGGSDKMYATAVAKPFDGSIGPTRAYIRDGRSTVDAAAGQDQNYQFGGVFLSEGLTEMREFMQPTYRARLAGINEWTGNSGGALTPAGALAASPDIRLNRPEEMLH